MKEEQSSTILYQSNTSLNILQRYLHNKNRYKRRSQVISVQTPIIHHHKQIFIPIKNSINHPLLFKGYENSIIQKNKLDIMKERNSTSELKSFIYRNSDYCQFIHSQRRNLRLNKGRFQSQIHHNRSSTQNINRQIIGNTQFRDSILTIPALRQEIRLPSKENINLRNNQTAQYKQKWKKLKKKKYLDSQFLSIKKFIINTKIEQLSQKKYLKDLSDIYFNTKNHYNTQTHNEYPKISKSKLKNTQTIQIQPWDYDSNQLQS